MIIKGFFFLNEDKRQMFIGCLFPDGWMTDKSFRNLQPFREENKMEES
jgi:hypothetical protein